VTYAFDCEALLLAGNNANADYSVKHYKGKFNAYQRTYVITLCDEKHSYHYARFALQYRLSELKRISKGTNTKYLTLELLNNIRIPLPSPEVQEKFSNLAAGVERLRDGHSNHLRMLDCLFASLQDRVFSGELPSNRAASALELVG
jgi:type I restriction enzyme, S subunit